jgi:hypothetical protein
MKKRCLTDDSERLFKPGGPDTDEDRLFICQEHIGGNNNLKLKTKLLGKKRHYYSAIQTKYLKQSV